MKYSKPIQITAVLVAMLTLLGGCASRRTADEYDSDAVAWGSTTVIRAVPFDPAAAAPPPPVVTPTAELPALVLGSADPSTLTPATASTGETGVQGISPYVSATQSESAAAEVGQLPGQATPLGSALSGNAATPGVATTNTPGTTANSTIVNRGTTITNTAGGLTAQTQVMTTLSPSAQLGARSVRVNGARGAGGVGVSQTSQGGILISNIR